MNSPFMSKFECWICGSTLPNMEELCKHVRQCKYIEEVQARIQVHNINEEIKQLEKQIQERRKIQETLINILCT